MTLANALGMNPPTGKALKAPNAAAIRATTISSLVVTSAEMTALTTTSAPQKSVLLGKPLGTLKCRGPGQSVPKRYPGRSQGLTMSNVRRVAHEYGTHLKCPFTPA